MDQKKSFFTCLILLESILLYSAVAKELHVTKHVGENVTLPCTVDIKQCGKLHSVKWYRDTSRIYVFSEAGRQVARAEGDATERMTVEYNETENQTFLTISNVTVEDEATYKCEITYWDLDVHESCDVVQIVKLTTLVKPKSVKLLFKGEDVTNTGILGPKDEGSEIELTCIAEGGKPRPTVSWYNGSQYIITSSKRNDKMTSSQLQLTLSRNDLNAKFKCEVESEALKEPMTAEITVDVNVKATRIELTGAEDDAIQGSPVSLKCEVFGAKPAAKIQWINGSQPITNTTTTLIRTLTERNKNGTFTTKSSLNFIASRWHHGNSFECHGGNNVSRKLYLEKIKYLNVRYPPVIRVYTPKTVFNENDTEDVTLECTFLAYPQNLTGATWFKDGKNLTRIKGKHENGNMKNPSLTIRKITREDMGNYTCWLKNEVGEEESEESIFLDVQYPPNVEVIMKPSTPVKAADSRNVTLECNVTSGNPTLLRGVRWFLDNELMKELVLCNDSQSTNENLTDPFCGIDPSLLSLIKVEENFAGNYTCQGENDVGYGPVSEPQELEVYFPPTPAKLRYYPSTVIKKASVTLECTVDHPGHPDNVTYKWFRGSLEIHNITVSKWTIHQASLETRSSFSCIAMNEGGESAPANVSINVLAPPAFIGNLNSYKGVLYSAKNVSLTCRIECFPLCDIKWFKDGQELNTDKRYYIKNTDHPADYNKNDFESVESTLYWNMTNWPNQQLNKSAPHSHYTCESVPRSASPDNGPPVNFTTEIAVDFPPEDVHVNEPQVNVTEDGDSPPAVKCSGKGRPKLNYVWKRNLASEPIAKGDTLRLDEMSKSKAGIYICEAYNKYGNQTAHVNFNFQYKPQCSIQIGEKDGNQALICIAEANPEEISFTWKIAESNDTIDSDNIYNVGVRSYLIIDSYVEAKTYKCIANNSIGTSSPCEISVPGYQEQSSQIGKPGTIPWYKSFSRENLIIIIASIVTLIICVIIVCIVIIVLCRRKRANTKCNNPLEMEEREKPDGQSPDTSSNQSKWPLKPGVLVHVNKMHHVNISQLSSYSIPFKTTSVSKSNTFLKYRKNKSKVYARLQRLKDLLGFTKHDRVPSGITEGAGGVVTYKKIKPTIQNSETINSRKRKKPGFAPNPSSTGDKMRLGAAPPVGCSADPANDHDKGFYENLPFHGMQNPPNKPISVIAPFNQETTYNNFPVQTEKSLLPVTQTSAFIPCNKMIQRHQSFHGFQNNQQMHQTINFPQRFNFNRNLSNPYLNSSNSIWPNWSNFHQRNFRSQNITNQQVRQTFRFSFQNNFQPILNFNPFLLPNPFSIPPQTNRITGRRETDIRRTASGINISKNEEPKDETNTEKIISPTFKLDSDKRFGSLEIKKHKCYSPTFYSMRCKKHAKKRPVVYALPKKVFGDLKPANENNPEMYENLTNSIQIFEQNAANTDDDGKEPEKILPIPAPRCKKHRKNEVIYQNVSRILNTKNNCLNLDVSNSSNDGSENLESQVSVIEALVHNSDKNEQNELESQRISNKSPPKLIEVSPKSNPSIDSSNSIIKVEAVKALKNSPMLKVSPNFIKPKTESPKGALSLQIQAKRKNSTDNLNQSDDSKENFPLIPQMPLLNPQNKWSPSLANTNHQNAFYTLTTPHYKHLSVGLPPQYSATIPHQKHTKLIPRALFNEQLPKSKSFSSKPKHKKHFQIPLQKCHSFKFQTAESYFQPIKNIHEEDLMKNGYVSDYPESSKGRHYKREKPKQKTKGPLVLKRPNEYRENVQFPENVQNSVQLQYPQPVVGWNVKKPNGVVYADLDMPKTTNKKNTHETTSAQSKSQKSKPKTEYATLTFNDIGQEIDV